MILPTIMQFHYTQQGLLKQLNMEVSIVDILILQTVLLVLEHCVCMSSMQRKKADE